METPDAAAATIPSQPTTPTNAAGAPSAMGPPPAQAVDVAAQLKALQKERDDKVREGVVRRRQLEGQIKQQQEQLKELATLKKEFESAKLNPEAHLSKLYGEKWYDAITEAKINGVPPAAVIAQEMERLETKMRGEFEARENARHQSQRQLAQQQQTAQEAQQRGAVVAFVKSAEADYPAILNRFDSHEAAGLAVYEHAKQVFLSTAKFDENSNLLAQGRILGWKESADELETKELERATKLSQHEKYKEKFSPPLTADKNTRTIGGPRLSQSTQSQGNTVSQRKTLSNEITGSTTGQKPPATREEKRLRAIQRYNELRKPQP